MPQFDTFSFFSQIFWVLLFYTLLYLSLTYYILPAIATTLKVRKRKLSAQSLTTDSIAISNSSVGFNNHLQSFTALVTNEVTNSKINFDELYSRFSSPSLFWKSGLFSIIINERHKAFLSKFYSSLFDISLFARG
jgi:hypothetical protein